MALTRQDLLNFGSYDKLAAAVVRGDVSVKDVRTAYSRLRKQLNAQVKAIAKSDVGFSRGEMNYFRSVRNLVTTRDLLHEVSDAIRFATSARYTIRGRRAIRDKAIATLQARGINVTAANWNEWVNFITWFKSSAYSALYDSDSDVVMDVFEHGSNPREWERMFKEWNMNH